MKKFDRTVEFMSRTLANQSSRRGFLGVFGAMLVGSASIPLLPVARASDGSSTKGNGYPGVGEQSTGNPQDPGDPSSCDYWRYCAIDGFLCSCCGGSQNACPPGTEMSPITWIGTCQNPADGINYIISYNDCCGKSSCGRCLCNRNESDKPMARPQANNDTNWCLGTESAVYTCSTAVIIGTALEG
ncbi:methylamine dehydrogenase light chain [Kordiimonas pumila]|uniref:Methylamine dehydrogenase (amicyanin) n=1 Tax=Kordiimonas pumila TaxID=2161677 RepID=A0ABV7D4I8_9PROT|nr:methylamine dehydrogenase light chain [Kordiimonas pumila]